MKKILVAIVCTLSVYYSNAQVTFEPGIRAGLNYSRFTQVDSPLERFTPKADFYVGVYGKLQLTKKYSMNPTITYTRQGANKEVINGGVITSSNMDVNYLGIANLNKFTFGKVSLIAGPTLDILMKNNKKELGANGQFNTNSSIYNDVDFAIILGTEYEITDALGIEFRFKHSLSGASDSYNKTSTTYFYDHYNHIDNIVYQLGLTYTFKKSKKE